MPPDNRHTLWNRDDHPSLELLEQYHEGLLPDALHHQLERHLLDCDLCSDALEGLTVSNAGQTERDVQAINRHISVQSRRKISKTLPVYLTDWKVAAALALMLLSSIVVFYYNYQQVSEQQGIAAQQEHAIQDAMGQRDDQATTAPATVADAKPDTVRASHIAANTQQVPNLSSRPLNRKAPIAADEEFTFPDLRSDHLIELVEGINQNNTESITNTIPEGPPVRRQADKLAEVTVPSPQLALQPESPAAAKALQGRVAGVSVNRSNNLAPNQVQGQVTDQDGNPLPGVSVVVKGFTNGAATDAAGNFVLTLPDDKATLVFRYIGYETREKSVTASSGPIAMDLQVDNRALSEVVVTGYSTSTSSSRPAPVIAAKPATGSRPYRRYLEENLRYTSDMVNGRVVVRAEVATDGSLQNLEIARSLCESCDNEALRLVAQGPKWKPAKQDGQRINQTVRIVVRFRPEKAD